MSAKFSQNETFGTWAEVRESVSPRSKSKFYKNDKLSPEPSEMKKNGVQIENYRSDHCKARGALRDMTRRALTLSPGSHFSRVL